MLQRANYLKEHQSDSIHVLVNNTTVMVAVNSKTVPDVTAQKVKKFSHWCDLLPVRLTHFTS